MGVKSILNKQGILNKLVLILYISLFIFAFTACGLKSQNHIHNMPLPEVETIKISPLTKAKIIESTGELISPQTTEVSSENMGKIVYLNIPEGKEVSAGHVLARVDDSTTLADIKVAKAKLQNAKENFKRMQALKNEGAVSQQVLDNAIEQLQIAEGEFERAESLETKTSIVAPYTGLLSLRKVSLGAFIDSGDPVVRISQIDPLYLIFSFPEQYAPQIKIDQDIKFMISNSQKEYLAKLTVIDPYIDPNTRSVQLKAVVPNLNRELLPGKFANVRLEIANIKDAILIPQEALIQEDSKKQVAVVKKDNTVIFKEVTVSEWDKDSILISDGLMEGDVIVTSGHQKINSGSKVIPKSFSLIHNKILDKQIPE